MAEHAPHKKVDGHTHFLGDSCPGGHKDVRPDIEDAIATVGSNPLEIGMNWRVHDAAFAELCRLARLGALVEKMPKHWTLGHYGDNPEYGNWWVEDSREEEDFSLGRGLTPTEALQAAFRESKK